MPEDRGFGRRGEAIFTGACLKLWPRGECAGDILDKTAHAAVRVMAMGRLFRHHKQMAFVRDAQGAGERAQDEVVDIRVGIGMLVDQEAFSSGLIRAGEGEMAGPRPHNLDEKDAAHGGTGGFQRLDGLIRQRHGRMKTQGGRSRRDYCRSCQESLLAWTPNPS